MDIRRNTIQRRMILDSMRALDMHATAEQIYEHLIKKHSTISKATVYRNLGQMVEAGALVNIGSFYGSIHYDHNCHEHYHFTCVACKRIFDVNDYFSDICDKINTADEFEITGHYLTFSGLCRTCKEKKDARPI